MKTAGKGIYRTNTFQNYCENECKPPSPPQKKRKDNLLVEASSQIFWRLHKTSALNRGYQQSFMRQFSSLGETFGWTWLSENSGTNFRSLISQEKVYFGFSLIKEEMKKMFFHFTQKSSFFPASYWMSCICK